MAKRRPPDTEPARLGIVFQNYALFPHMTFAENVAYGLQAHKWPRSKIAPRVAEMLDLVHMGEFAQRKPGAPPAAFRGQQQRIALARCLAINPKVLLLDEPFGALDKNLRLDMQIEVKRLVRESGVTTILVTHDQEEALSMADRIAVMSRGVIEQVSRQPRSTTHRKPFVNEFVAPPMCLAGIYSRADGAPSVAVPGNLRFETSPDATFAEGTAVENVVPPEHLRIVSTGGAPGTIKAVLPLGAT